MIQCEAFSFAIDITLHTSTQLTYDLPKIFDDLIKNHLDENDHAPAAKREENWEEEDVPVLKGKRAKWRRRRIMYQLSKRRELVREGGGGVLCLSCEMEEKYHVPAVNGKRTSKRRKRRSITYQLWKGEEEEEEYHVPAVKGRRRRSITYQL